MFKLLTSVAFCVFPLFIYSQPIDQSIDTSIKQYIEKKTFSSLRISNSGRHVALKINQEDIETNRLTSTLAVYEFSGKKLYQSEDGNNSYSNLSWHPNKEILTYSRNKNLIYLSPTGKKINSIKLPFFSEYLWLPDGDGLILIEKDSTHSIPFARYTLKGKLSANSKIKLHNLKSQKTKTLFNTHTSLSEFSISPNGKLLAFVERKAEPNQGYFGLVKILNLETTKISTLVGQPGAHRNLIWDDSSSSVIFESKLDKSISNSPSDIYRARLTDKNIINLTDNYPENTFPISVNQNKLLFRGLKSQRSAIFEKNLNDGQISELTTPFIEIAHAISATGAPNKILLAGAEQDGFLLPAILNKDTNKLIKLGARTFDWNKWTDYKTELINWKSEDNLTIDGILFKPVDFDPQKKYPLIVSVHGGPRAQDYPLFSRYEISHLPLAMQKGALVLKVNYRGSIGKGDKFVKAHYRSLGKDVLDVINGTNFVIKQGYIDTSKIVLQGWSYGGFISAYATTMKEHPFVSTYVGAGISDWTVHYVHEYENVTTRDFSFAATPWQDPEIYRSSSPITYINNAHTPTLIVHGDKDPVVHVSSAQLLYHGLKDRNIDVEYLEFENMGHWASQPKQKYALHWYSWAWLSRHLFDKEVKIPETLQLKRYD